MEKTIVNEEHLVDRVVRLLDAGEEETLWIEIESLHAADAASLLESLPPKARAQIWIKVPEATKAETLAYLHDEVRAALLQEMGNEQLLQAAKQMEVEDIATVIEQLPEDRTEALLECLEDDYRSRVEKRLSFDEGTAGRLMSADVVSVRPDVSLAVVLRYLHVHETLPDHTDALMVIDEDGHYVGKLPIATVVTGHADALVQAVLELKSDWVYADMSEHDLALLFDRRDLISVAVLDQEDKLLGRITIDDVIDVIRQEAEHAMMNMAGLSEEEDLFAPVYSSMKRRTVWLGINLLTVLLAVWVIGQFEETLQQFVVLAVLMPVVASMGGIAGSQTLTLTIRGLALDKIAASNVNWLTRKEVAIGVLNGLLWAAITAIVAVGWFGDVKIGVVIAAAMLINLVAAAASGIAIPLILTRMDIDPALSGAVILTTVTDVVGFLSFLGLATLYLL